MKTFFTSIIRLVLPILFLTLCTSAFSQKTVTWKGGAPGHETEWNYAKNWSTYAIPDGFSNVVIPDVSTTSLASPVIQMRRVEVNTLYIEPTALLTVEKGALLVVNERIEGTTKTNLRMNGLLFLPYEAEKKTDKTRATAAVEKKVKTH